MQVIEILKPNRVNLIFHQDATMLTFILGGPALPVLIPPGTITLRYRVNNTTYTLDSVNNPSAFSIMPETPNAWNTKVTVSFPPGHLALATEKKKAEYLITYQTPADPEPVNAMAGLFWRKVWVG